MARQFLFMKLNELERCERPREKLLEKGAGALSDKELLAIILRTGTSRKNVVELAADLLERGGGNFVSLSALSREEMRSFEGIGPDKSATLSALFEIGRRFMAGKPHRNRPSISNPEAVCKVVAPHLRGLDHEECWILSLSRTNRLLGMEKLSSGSLNNTTIDNKMILRRALDKRAEKVILVHNHPSDDPTPGPSDIRATIRLKSALQVLDIELIDHVVYSDSGFYSFSDNHSSALK